MNSHDGDSCQGRSREPRVERAGEVTIDKELSVLADARRLLVVFAAEAVRERTLGDPSEMGVEGLAELRELAGIVDALSLPAVRELLDEEDRLFGPVEAVANGSGG